MKTRLATQDDLPELKIMFDEIVKKMNNDGICIWNEFYPYEEFADDIKNSNLYVITNQQKIIASFGLYPQMTSSENFNWEKTNCPVLYIARVVVNINNLRQGLGSKIIEQAKLIAKQQNVQYLRLNVVEINTPAKQLYIKNGFRQVNGIYKEFSPTLNKTLCEFGYELKI